MLTIDDDWEIRDFKGKILKPNGKTLKEWRGEKWKKN